jgi:hypothetical protein
MRRRRESGKAGEVIRSKHYSKLSAFHWFLDTDRDWETGEMLWWL